MNYSAETRDGEGSSTAKRDAQGTSRVYTTYVSRLFLVSLENLSYYRSCSCYFIRRLYYRVPTENRENNEVYHATRNVQYCNEYDKSVDLWKKEFFRNSRTLCTYVNAFQKYEVTLRLYLKF